MVVWALNVSHEWPNLAQQCPSPGTAGIARGLSPKALHAGPFSSPLQCHRLPLRQPPSVGHLGDGENVHPPPLRNFPRNGMNSPGGRYVLDLCLQRLPFASFVGPLRVQLCCPIDTDQPVARREEAGKAGRGKSGTFPLEPHSGSGTFFSHPLYSCCLARRLIYRGRSELISE